MPVREQQRLHAIANLGLLGSDSVPVFEEATQTGASFLEMPICILGLMESDNQRFKASVGLSRLGLMNPLAVSRQLARNESFCRHVVDSQQVLAIEDACAQAEFASSLLVQRYGIRAYLGVPLMTSDRQCLGTLAVMGFQPHKFTQKEIGFLELTARWCMSELERQQTRPEQPKPAIASPSLPESRSVVMLRADLLTQLTQELRTPLTSVMGMTSVLTREIYGPLTSKQKEYLTIIHHSGQHLLSLVNEILELSELQDSDTALALASSDIEMVCQQAISSLEPLAQRRSQSMRLSIEPGCRLWLLDKAKVKQMLYYLMFSVMQSSSAGSTVHLHASRREDHLTLTVWKSHRWLDELNPVMPNRQSSRLPVGSETTGLIEFNDSPDSTIAAVADPDYILSSAEPTSALPCAQLPPETESTRAMTGDCAAGSILLCDQLVRMHYGRLTTQGTRHRYVISLPRLPEMPESVEQA